MIDALVRFGVKDQNVVLSTMGKIKKGKADLAKKSAIGFEAIKAGQSSKAATAAGVTKEKQNADRQAQADKKEITATERFTKAAQGAGNMLKTVASAAASLNPVQFIQGMLSAAGTAATAIPFLGSVAKGALEVAGISVGAAGGAIGSAKTNIPAALELEKRNAASNRYGGDLFKSPAELARKEAAAGKNAKAIAGAEAFDAKQNTVPAWFPQFAAGMKAKGYDDAQAKKALGIGTSNTADALRSKLESESLVSDTKAGGSAGWTPTDKAQFISAVSGAFGKVNKPLADTLNDLIGQGKNVEQLTQVSSGNWNALGTDEGAILQQITNSFSGALPSIKQELQSELLKSYGKDVETESPEMKARRANAAAWEQAGEKHTQSVANAAQAMGATLLRLNNELNKVELKLISGANKLADAVATAVSVINPG